MPTESTISMKPHHFVDILRDLGNGDTDYRPHPYGHGLHTVAADLLVHRDAILRIELGMDDICAPCRHNFAGRCDDTIDISFRPAAPSSKQEYNLLLDQRWCEQLDVSQGDELPAAELCRRILANVDAMPAIYRENPLERITPRMEALVHGARAFLGETG